MPFGPGAKIKVGTLNKATPTPFDNASLKKSLENIGLSCAQINDQNLSTYITNVKSQLPDGAIQSMAIKAPHTSPLNANRLKAVAPVTLFTAATAVPKMTSAATGNWSIPDNNDAEGYGPNLEIIQYQDHFNWLFDNKSSNGFTGVKNSPPATSGNYPNAEAIQKLFVQVGLTASSTLVKGLDKPTMTATLSNVIQPLNDSNISNYDVSDSRVIDLVDNYDPKTGMADGIGVLTVSWHLTIEDYKRKTKDGGDTHATYLKMNAWSVLYTDPGVLCQQYSSVLQHFAINAASAPSCRTS
ncbi:hypothetical protein [Thalassospira mesophila]|uniref:Uncharacterized protein n=1 Tax=Thalassospira mesophila TaxID=1293891 RepID=A0A1Y2KX12_9PROT|nr:hypothetical protein [Thalassospira mesophila]OSQ36757.1 hypothetical protein TMES_16930 [Thalassospira mesophila]